MAKKVTDKGTTQLATRIAAELHTRVKLACVRLETTISEFVVEALEKKLKSKK